MIGTIQGAVRHKDLHAVIVDAGGVGYKIFTTADAALDALPGENVFFWTYLSVKENALDLFGFPDRDSLELFELLIGVSGIGPKTALSILNVATPEMLRQAVAEEDTGYLTKVSGIGKKNAEKIVLELRDKLPTAGKVSGRSLRSEGDAMEALLSLGYGEREARSALKRLAKSELGTAEKVKEALKLLAESDAR